MSRSRPRPDWTSPWIGWRVDDARGERLGVLAGVYEDAATAEEAWYLVRLGGRAPRFALTPPANALVARGRICLPYERERIEASPPLSKAPETTSAELERDLRHHYGISGGDRQVAIGAVRRAGAGGL